VLKCNEMQILRHSDVLHNLLPVIPVFSYPAGILLIPMSMPPKSKNPANAKESAKCAVCCQKVTVGENEALYCMGKCGWMHRYCAGVSFTQYQELSSESAGKFVCLTCSQQANNVTVKELKVTIKKLT